MVIVGFEEAMKMAAGENYRDIYVMQPTAIRYMNIREIHVAVKKGAIFRLWSRRTSVSRLTMVIRSAKKEENLVFRLIVRLAIYTLPMQ